MKRLFDIFFSFIGLALLLPFMLFVSLSIAVTSGFPFLYFQKRVGKNGIDFLLIKFRTMKKNADKEGLLTVGEKGKRITPIGYWLRRYKIDELPQLFNVLIGNMSLVGPRPEVRKYVELYTPEQKKVLSVKPGITDYASIVYSNESAVLERAEDPERMYIAKVMPSKIKLNLKYIEDQNLLTDMKVIFKTVGKVIS